MPPLPAPNPDLHDILRKAFGFNTFLANQESVCRMVTEGRDVLLVMPTGSGKSLCYQLPAIARGGTTLVVSPLIALMEDQVAKLKSYGFAVERIHSGRRRLNSRQVCHDYLAGKLQFLFIAPERLRVEGFPEMLAKRPVSLIVVDEAHCISQWGHDFRPDYRRLGQYVPNLRPAPVIALTATATPPVQHDIVTQLGLQQPARFIHGFHRSNIAIEAVEVPPSERFQLTRELLAQPQRCPAIVYTPTRKQSESLAKELGAWHPTEAYHAGLDAGRRKKVQEDFLAGKLEVIVATIAFGMGIDKPDVRTVIHTALPGSIEAYYQEIGRAGRDGKPSRALLMHSYADRRTHDYFIERDYPDVSVLAEIFGQLRSEPIGKRELLNKLLMDPETFDRALEKLWTHGGAMVDYAENVSRGHHAWREPYRAQGDHKRQQVELMIRYAESPQCRMLSVVRYFGDVADGDDPCGICDNCAPKGCGAQRFRPATAVENAAALRVLAVLRASGSKSTGKLYAGLFPGHEMNRNDFEELLGGMAHAGLVGLSDAVFEKDGRQIPYRTVQLTRQGTTLGARAPLQLMIKDREPSPTPRRQRKKVRGMDALLPKAGTMGRSQGPASSKRQDSPLPSGKSSQELEESLRAWRLQEARRLGIPAFRIFADRALTGLVERRPSNPSQMLSVPGVGLRIAQKYGAEICRILSSH